MNLKQSLSCWYNNKYLIERLNFPLYIQYKYSYLPIKGTLFDAVGTKFARRSKRKKNAPKIFIPSTSLEGFSGGNQNTTYSIAKLTIIHEENYIPLLILPSIYKVQLKYTI
jgi:hypothetical protein